MRLRSQSRRVHFRKSLGQCNGTNAIGFIEEVVDQENLGYTHGQFPCDPSEKPDRGDATVSMNAAAFFGPSSPSMFCCSFYVGRIPTNQQVEKKH